MVVRHVAVDAAGVMVPALEGDEPVHGVARIGAAPLDCGEGAVAGRGDGTHAGGVVASVTAGTRDRDERRRDEEKSAKDRHAVKLAARRDAAPRRYALPGVSVSRDRPTPI